MSYVIKVPNHNTFVRSYYVGPKDANVHVIYSDDSKSALTFDDMADVATHYGFIVNNMSILDLGTKSLCIAEVQTYYKEL